MTALALRRASPLARSRALLIGLGLAAIAVGYATGPELFFTGLLGVGLVAFARSAAEAAFAIALAVFFRLALAVGAFHFEPSDQIVDLATRDVNPLWFIIQNDIWWPRYLFSYLAVFGMDNWGYRLERSFALYSAALLPIEVFVITRASSWLLRPRLLDVRAARFAGQIVATLLVLALATQMNGRLIPAHIGMALILFAQCVALSRRSWTWVESALSAMGLVMGQMTSGTGVIVFTQLVLGSVLIAITVERVRWKILSQLWIVVALALPFIYRGIDKNVTFFGGGLASIPNMLQHGAGGHLEAHPAVVLALVVASVLGIALAALYGRAIRSAVKPTPTEYPLLLAVPISLAGGLFGYSTLTMIVPALFIVGCVVAGAAAAQFDRSSERNHAPKRIFDFFMGVPLFLVAAPLIGVLMLGVRISSPGPALFTARRIGKNERVFTQYKLRTMAVGADQWGFRTSPGDSRITRFGRFLRVTSLDELPQLWNVLRGDMSLVGPRPAALEQLADYTPEERRIRARVTPGITGLAQVNGRSDLGLVEATDFDLWYVEHSSMALDLEILLRTIGVTLLGKGTN